MFIPQTLLFESGNQNPVLPASSEMYENLFNVWWLGFHPGWFYSTPKLAPSWNLIDLSPVGWWYGSSGGPPLRVVGWWSDLAQLECFNWHWFGVPEMRDMSSWTLHHHHHHRCRLHSHIIIAIVGAPVESRVSTRIDARASFVKENGTDMTRVSCGYEAHLTRASKFLTFWPIFQIWTHFQNVNTFSKFLPLFKVLTHFCNVDPFSSDSFSKFRLIFKILTHFQNVDPFS